MYLALATRNNLDCQHLSIVILMSAFVKKIQLKQIISAIVPLAENISNDDFEFLAICPSRIKGKGL